MGTAGPSIDSGKVAIILRSLTKREPDLKFSNLNL
jgi:hypothetical protein